MTGDLAGGPNSRMALGWRLSGREEGWRARAKRKRASVRDLRERWEGSGEGAGDA